MLIEFIIEMYMTLLWDIKDLIDNVNFCQIKMATNFFIIRKHDKYMV